MRSILRAVGFARARGITTEIVAMLDNPDTETLRYFSSRDIADVQVHKVAFGDPGLTRNEGVRLSSADHVAFLDADDLFCENWLVAACSFASSIGQRFVLHPEYSLCFGREDLVARHASSVDSNFSFESLIEFNYWSALCFAPRKLLLDVPFVRASLEEGFGYEDWHWYCEILSARVNVYVVPDTCVFVRRKQKGSRLGYHNQGNALMPWSRMFVPSMLTSLIRKGDEQSPEVLGVD